MLNDIMDEVSPIVILRIHLLGSLLHKGTVVQPNSNRNNIIL